MTSKSDRAKSDRESAETMTHAASPPPDESGEKSNAREPFDHEHEAASRSRYELGRLLGRGGSGVVTAATDRQTHRVVALKTLRSSVSRSTPTYQRFLEEARITAQLEHPSIIPIYDVSTEEDARPFYTMRVVERRSLWDVLRNPELKKEWPLARLLGVIAQVSRAIAYAHTRGVVHRDLKPANILLGDFGEVYVADWGLARVSATSTIVLHTKDSTPPPRDDFGGTPGYMPPEAFGIIDKSDHRADLFALGVVLYEVLTGAKPFAGKTTEEIIHATRTKPIQAPRTIVATCPLLLEDLCMSLLARNPNARPPSANEIAKQIEAFLEGDKERERRRDEALTLCAKAKAPIAKASQLASKTGRLRDDARRLLAGVKGWEPVAKKRVGWSCEDESERAEREAAVAIAEAIDLFTKALGYDAECEAAHRGLAEVYWERARTAEEGRRTTTQMYYEALVRDHDDGTFRAALGADATLSITSDPLGAEVFAERYLDLDRQLVPTAREHIGVTPLRDVNLAPGSYRLTLTSKGRRDVRYPVLLQRGAHHEGNVRLYDDRVLGDGFIYIPRGSAIIGGDPEAYTPLDRHAAMVDDFAIAEFPITMRDYCTYLDELEEIDPKLALKRAPQDKLGAEGFTAIKGESGLWEPSSLIIEGAARELFPIEGGHLWNVPVHLVTWFDAREYIRWRAAGEANVRMPTEIEWEKAARGVDGRFYPWGDRFDPTFCLMRDSRPFVAQPEPVGTFEADVSPYGVRDMAGGMREWIGDIFGQKSADDLDDEAEPDESVARGDSGFRMVRSGMWNADHKWARAASRGPLHSLQRGFGLTFRLAKTLGR